MYVTPALCIKLRWWSGIGQRLVRNLEQFTVLFGVLIDSTARLETIDTPKSA
jgi:hypothetical protein